MTGLDWGVFVTAKVEEDEGSIVQIVICHFDEAKKVEYAKRLLRLASPLLSFIYSIDAIRRGFLEDDEVPDWVSESHNFFYQLPLQDVECLLSTSERRW